MTVVYAVIEAKNFILNKNILSKAECIIFDCTDDDAVTGRLIVSLMISNLFSVYNIQTDN